MGLRRALSAGADLGFTVTEADLPEILSWGGSEADLPEMLSWLSPLGFFKIEAYQIPGLSYLLGEWRVQAVDRSQMKLEREDWSLFSARTSSTACALHDTSRYDQINHISAELQSHGAVEGMIVFYWFQNARAREKRPKKKGV
ncbi:hypothetical protein SUGI_0313670 [Cryptomeria japonica]|nr:hypothetical protein SUGI_0313670 [Cryptomeria japonica]